MDAKQLGNMPAYAHTTTKQIDRGQNGYVYKDIIAGGITLRQHFAGLAMQAIIAQEASCASTASDAVAYADALLIELSKEQP